MKQTKDISAGKTKGNDIHIHLDEIPPEVADTLARGCLRLYYQIIAMPNGRELLDDAWEKYQQRKNAEAASSSADSSSE